jgi:very-short-patch-repair endonuclease
MENIKYLYELLEINKNLSWNYELNNNINYNTLTRGSSKKYWFICNNCNHNINVLVKSIKLDNKNCVYCDKKKFCEDNCNTCYNNSFAKHEKSQYWDYELNNIKPNQVSYSSGKSFWFNCENTECLHKFERKIEEITRLNLWCKYCKNEKDIICPDENCNKCFHKCIMSIDNWNKYQIWNYELNKDINPKFILKESHNKYWFKCIFCTNNTEIIIKNLKNNTFCCECAKKFSHKTYIIPYENSFASHEKSKYWNYELNNYLEFNNYIEFVKDINILFYPENISIKSKKHAWFNCDKCNHTFYNSISNITNIGRWCPYCTNQKLCDNKNCLDCYNKSFASIDNSKLWNYTKNDDIIPRQVYSCSDKKFWFKCDKCNHNYEQQIKIITKYNCGCPKCVNKTEAMIIDKLIQNNINFIHQYKVDWCKNKTHLPYDFYLPDYNIILECDGRQHFEDIKKWKSSYKLQQLKDAYKMKCANKKDINFIRIYQENIQLTQYKYDWYELLKYSLNELANDYTYDTKNIFIGIDNCGKNIYSNYEKNITKLMNKYSCDELLEFIENYEEFK